MNALNIPNGIVKEQKSKFEQGTKAQPSTNLSDDTSQLGSLESSLASVSSTNSVGSLASRTQNVNTANLHITTASEIIPVPSSNNRTKYYIKKQAPNMLNKLIRTSPETDLYRQLKSEAANIYKYASNNKKIEDGEMIKLFKYYVYFKILSKIVKSNGTKTIDEIVKEKVKKSIINQMPFTIRDRYVVKFSSLKTNNEIDFTDPFDEIVKAMIQKQSTIGTCINNM
jgi:hypothetical protein